MHNCTGVLDRNYCTQKHPDGTVTLPLLASVLPQLDMVALKECIARDSFCDVVDVQNPDAVKALHKNLLISDVLNCCTVHHGDNRQMLKWALL
ncbi:tRNA wybutosine-synthesizing protein 2 homolog [Myxocyprinus asiaticus]|uniref:tRNA wybutosine-synthesizing protein 2 homolog n=1 Tax=Myxocyprinus asiaticus TaxID=70543 RepID=UPI002223113F|nr:tRNA wybutosine-synthesizing protein 2 homolog [Myxocyprinus asiaticus]